MAVVTKRVPQLVSFSFHQEKDDADYGSCLWAILILTLNGTN